MQVFMYNYLRRDKAKKGDIYLHNFTIFVNLTALIYTNDQLQH